MKEKIAKNYLTKKTTGILDMLDKGFKFTDIVIEHEVSRFLVESVARERLISRLKGN